MVIITETLTSTSHHDIFTYLDYIFSCYLHIYIYIYIYIEREREREKERERLSKQFDVHFSVNIKLTYTVIFKAV